MKARSSPGGGPFRRRRLREFRLLFRGPVPIIWIRESELLFAPSGEVLVALTNLVIAVLPHLGNQLGELALALPQPVGVLPLQHFQLRGPKEEPCIHRSRRPPFWSSTSRGGSGVGPCASRCWTDEVLWWLLPLLLLLLGLRRRRQLLRLTLFLLIIAGAWGGGRGARRVPARQARPEHESRRSAGAL